MPDTKSDYSSNISNSWIKKLENLCASLSCRYTTKQQFEHELKFLLEESQCPLEGIFYDVISKAPYRNIHIGSKKSDSSEMYAYSPNDNRRTKCEIHQWWKKGVTERPSKIHGLLENLFECYWKSKLRTNSAGFIDLKREEKAVQLAEETLSYEAQKKNPVVVFDCDLDNFKAVNTTFGRLRGDRVIREFGACLESCCIENAILFHHGGDEFALLIPSTTPEDGLLLAYSICKEVNGYNFQLDDLQIGISVGISFDNNGLKSYSELRRDAEKGTDLAKKLRNKGTARFGNIEAFSKEPISLDKILKLGHCISKIGTNKGAPFSNAWINVISKVTNRAINEYGIESTRVKQSITAFLDWAKFDFVQLPRSRSWRARDNGIDLSEALSALDICYAIIHGAWGALISKHSQAKRSLNASIKYDIDNNYAALYRDSGDIFWESATSGVSSVSYDLGVIWECSKDVELSSSDFAPFILIHIGHNECCLPKMIFSDQIIVDDRPARGGGLPDFWEAVIARLISQILSNNNIAKIYVLGDQNYARSVVSKLKNINFWKADIEQLAYKTGAKVSEITRSVERLNGNIHFPDNEEMLLDFITEVIRERRNIQNNKKLSSTENIAPFLRKSISDDFRLASQDGCNVNTVAEAFPVALDIVRLCNDAQSSVDQAGKMMKELRGFKIHLSTPLQDMIPNFYRNDKDSLERYFKKEFVDDDGLFSRELKEDNQFDSVIKEVANIIESSGKKIATRRAILILPHHILPGLAPLGLVSVQIMPRFVGNKIKIHFSYVWRTVEALVGLPYSLYASVRYSEYITKKIIGQVQVIEERSLIEIGDVTYVAGSLHMFLDDYGQGIARRIVNEVSY